MSLCGYHLRCSNNGSKCLDCRHQHSDQNNDYLHDVLNVWSEGKEAIYLTEHALPQRTGEIFANSIV